MKTILLLRHAKSSWKNMELKDIDRPLNKRGLNDAPYMAMKFSNMNIKPDLIICSNSKRTLQTIKFFRDTFVHNYEFKISNKLYLTTSDELLNSLIQLDEKIKVVMLVCHNPGITDITNLLGKKVFDNIPTCGLVGFNYSGDWADLKYKMCDFLFFDYPKKIIVIKTSL